jgi:hypothetical protein
LNASDYFQLEVSEFYSVVADYFTGRGLPIPRDLESTIDRHLIDTGVLEQRNGKVYFRFACFFEYFLARYMREEQSFQELVLTDDEYMAYASEIDYLTGFDRTNKRVVQFVSDRLESLRNEFRNQHADKLTAINPTQLLEGAKPVSPEERQTYKSKLRDARLAPEERLAILDEAQQPSGEHSQEIRRSRPSTPESRIIHATMMLATVLRNSDLIPDKEFKKQTLRLVLETMADILDWLHWKADSDISALPENKVQSLFKDAPVASKKRGATLGPKEIQEVVALVVRQMTSLIASELIRLYGGTPSLEIPLRELIGDQSTAQKARMLAVLLYADLGLEGYPDRLDRSSTLFAPFTNYHDLLYHKLLYYYNFALLPSQVVSEIENALAGVIAQRQGRGRQSKADIISQLKRLFRRRRD